MSTIPLDGVPAAVLVGMSTGPRSFTALAAAIDTVPAGSTDNPERALSHPAVKGVITLLAAQEWVLDKLPMTPSRLELPGMISRAVGAATAGAILARRAAARRVPAAGPPGEPVAVAPGTDESTTDSTDRYAPLVGAGVAAGVAIATALVGVRIRAWCTNLAGRDWPGAVLEDVSSLGLAVAAVRAA